MHMQCNSRQCRPVSNCEFELFVACLDCGRFWLDPIAHVMHIMHSRHSTEVIWLHKIANISTVAHAIAIYFPTLLLQHIRSGIFFCLFSSFILSLSCIWDTYNMVLCSAAVQCTGVLCRFCGGVIYSYLNIAHAHKHTQTDRQKTPRGWWWQCSSPCIFLNSTHATEDLLFSNRSHLPFSRLCLAYLLVPLPKAYTHTNTWSEFVQDTNNTLTNVASANKTGKDVQQQLSAKFATVLRN